MFSLCIEFNNLIDKYNPDGISYEMHDQQTTWAAPFRYKDSISRYEIPIMINSLWPSDAYMRR